MLGAVKVQLDPGWRVAVQAIKSSPEVDRWADLVANAVEAGPSSAVAAMEEATEAVASSKTIQEALSEAAEADVGPLEELIEITARALDEAARAEEDDADSDLLLDTADADTYRALLKVWGVGNVVVIVVLACILSGQTLVILGSLAALAQLTGYSVKDLIRFLRDS